MGLRHLWILRSTMQRIPKERSIPSRIFVDYLQLSSNRSIHITSRLLAKKASEPLGVTGSVKISPALTLCRAPKKDLNALPSNPLVLFFPWLGATQRAIDKYQELYHSRGWDILIISSTAKHFLWPNNAQTLVDEALSYVTSREVLQEHSDFLVHAMSIGCFTYTVMFTELQNNGDKYQEFTSKIKGQIFDSIVYGTPSGMGKGFANSVTKSDVGNLSVRAAFAIYTKLTKMWTFDKYAELFLRFHANPVPIPTLIFYSLDDPNSDRSGMEILISGWRAFHPKMRVKYKLWSQSRHAAHLLLHREEYIAELDNYLASINLVVPPSHL